MKKKNGNLTPSDLTPLELAVMHTIWALGECGSREVIDAYNGAADRPLAVTTIRTVIANLRRKGYVAPVPTIERGMRFRPVVEREPVARRSFRQLIARFFGGSPSQAVAYLIQHENLDEAEIEQIQRMIQNVKKGGKAS